jgi:hypothetical protein
LRFILAKSFLYRHATPSFRAYARNLIQLEQQSFLVGTDLSSAALRRDESVCFHSFTLSPFHSFTLLTYSPFWNRFTFGECFAVLHRCVAPVIPSASEESHSIGTAILFGWNRSLTPLHSVRDERFPGAKLIL